MRHSHRRAQQAAMLLLLAMPASAQEAKDKGVTIKPADFSVQLHGTIRSKYEYQYREEKGRFEVRTARFSLSGDINPKIAYKAEIDLCDEGKIKMLDAYARLRPPVGGLQFTIGQMRVPFTIDAHRSPDKQYFANRSFIAKQVGNVRDVGAMLRYDLRAGTVPITLEAGAFNGSGLTNQKDYWTNSINFSAKAQAQLPAGFGLELSAQKIKPADVTIMMYDAGANFRAGGLFIEAEYLYKHYAGHTYRHVDAVDAFACYDIPLRRCYFSKISPLLRYDYMGNHSDGLRYNEAGKEITDADDYAAGRLITTDYRRSRITGGLTLSIDKPFISDIRLNYEKYFYGHGGVAKKSEKDKFVVEFMARF